MSQPTWQFEAGVYRCETERARLNFDPARGLVDVQAKPAGPTLPQLLGVEIIDAVDLGLRPLVDPQSPPEIVIRQDVLLAIYAPTPRRPVECHARWRIHPQGVFDLEVSALTPGKWTGLSVQTGSLLAEGSVARLARTNALVAVHRPKDHDVSYVEMCHPHDGVGLDVGPGPAVRFRLFGHDLEKGVILRGRLRGLLVPRQVDETAARQAYQRFLEESPNLSL